MSSKDDYPNKDLVVIGPDGGSPNAKFDTQSHYGHTFNKPPSEGHKQVSGSFTPALNYSQFLTRHAPHPFRVRHMNGQ